MLALPHKGIQGEHTLKHIKGDINKVLPEDKSMQRVYTGIKLGTDLCKGQNQGRALS